MLKMIMLAGTMTMSAPALAQTATPMGSTAQATAPTRAVPATTAAGAQTAPMDQSAAQPAAQDAGATPAATPSQSQVAQVVDQQFGTYDKDGNGSLSKAEFAAWMTALKAQANAKAATPAEETAWNDAAFRQADGDKSATVSKTELTGFLVRGASGKS